jgi:FAD/FMN-containing dehydrogenase
MDLTRRAVLLAGLAAARVAVGTAATEGTFAAHSRELPLPPLDGELHFDKASRVAAADDFGHIVYRTPKGVLLPGSDQDVATTIRWAGGLGHKIAPQGQSHSVYGRAQVRAGIVIDMTQLRTVHDVQNDRVVVDAGAKWSEVLAVTLPQGLTPPVLTEYLELSAGGTLYPVSAFPMSRDDWRRHFGATWGRLCNAKQHFDPGHVLTPGYEVF